MSLRSYCLIIILATTSTLLTNCVKIPEIVDGGADVIDGSVGDLGVLNPGPDGARDVPSNRDDGSVLDLDVLAMGDGDGGAGTDPDGSFGDGSSLESGTLDGNGGCVGAGQMICGGACVDSQTSAMHCGACGNRCAMGQSCVSGECRCAGTQVSCGGACVDTQTNSNHCGRCGSPCPVGINCVGGVCACPMMGQIVCGGTCVNTQSSVLHCGMCNNACVMGRACTAGSCQCPAASPQVCAGACVNTTTDNNNCGGCGTVCGASRVCVGGMCQCAAPSEMCGASCVTTATDSANCGACNRACGATQTCLGGACVCPMGQQDCAANGTCLDLSSNTNNCGACGRVCPVAANATATCAAGSCGVQCLPNFADCDGNAANGCEVDLSSSTANCGSCGARCATGVCLAGGCQQWARQVGNPSNGQESGLDAAEDPSGNVYFVGSARVAFSLGGASVPAMGEAGFIASYTPRGALRWSRIVDSIGSDSVTTVSVRRTAQGVRVFIGGNAGGPVNLGNGVIGAGGNTLSFMAEYDENGVHQWSTFMRRTGGTAFSINDSAIAPSGDVYVASSMANIVIQGMMIDNPNFMSISPNAVLLKFNPMGQFQWSRWVGSAGNVSDGLVVAADGLNNVIFGGRVDSIVDAGGGMRGTANQQNDMFIAKYDSNNVHQWSGVYGSNNTDQLLMGIAVNPFSNDVSIAGHFQSGLDFGAGPVLFGAPLPNNTFLANFRAAGNFGQPHLVTARSLQTGALGDASPARLAYTSDARLFLHESYFGTAMIGGYAVPAGPGRRTFVAELNPDSLVAMTVLGFNGLNSNNFSNGITGCGLNYVCVTGNFNPNWGFAMTTLTNSANANDDDIFMARVFRP